ncbi:SR-related and CTD-associated factor 8 [Rhinophrynus dorsalis]
MCPALKEVTLFHMDEREKDLTAIEHTVVSSGSLGIQPPPPLTVHIPNLNIPGRIANMPFLDVHQGLLQQPTATRFPLLQPGIPPPPQSMLPPGLIDPTIHTLSFPPGDVFSHSESSFGVKGKPNADTINILEERLTLPINNNQQECDQDYRFPPIENHENMSHPIPNKQESEGITVKGTQEKQEVNSAEKHVQERHPEDDIEPQDMAVVDPSECEEKAITEYDINRLSPEVLHEAESKLEFNPLESVRETLLHGHNSKGTNTLCANDSQVRPPGDARDHFGDPSVDILPTYQRHRLDVSEFFGRPALEGMDQFVRLPLEVHDHYGKHSIENRDHYRQSFLESRNLFVRSLVDGSEFFGRPPPDMREKHGRLSVDCGSRQEQLHFPFDKLWGHRGDFDERQHNSFSGIEGPKGFHDDRLFHGYFRHETRNISNWNSGIQQDAHKDFDDRHHLWERQRDTDDRDIDFRREVNGNRFGRQRQQSNWDQPQVFEYFQESTSNQKADSIPQVNGENTGTSSLQEMVIKSNDPKLCAQQESSVKVNEEKIVKDGEVESQPMVESTETDGT